MPAPGWRGWRLDAAAQLPGTQYELPGPWLSAEEIHVLLTMQHLLAHLDTGGLLGPHIATLTERLHKTLGSGVKTSAEVARRIRVQSVGARKVHLPHFEAMGSALLRRLRLHIDYHGRGRGESRERTVSPQRLIHYRDNWYLDAWCHLRRGLRSFALDAMRSALVLDRSAIDVSDARLDRRAAPPRPGSGRVPHARGDEPLLGDWCTLAAKCSPRTWG